MSNRLRAQQSGLGGISGPLQSRERWREHRRRRFRRRSRRAYIRSVYALPSLATLGNVVCGFAAMYICTLPKLPGAGFWGNYPFLISSYLIWLAMVFDALDGRLARFARHTTDFGGQLDSMADVISFGCAPAFIALRLFHSINPPPDSSAQHLVWAIAALYVCCAAIRLARFNVSNEHGEQHHFSFLGLPSPGAGGTVVAMVLLQQRLLIISWPRAAEAVTWVLPGVVLLTGLLMVSHIRYPHLVNRHLRGRRSPATLVGALAVILAIIVWHWYVLAAGTLLYVVVGCGSAMIRQMRKSSAAAAPAAKTT